MFCSFSRYGYHPDLYMNLFNAVTGIKLSWEKAQELANSIYSLERRFNIREGFTLTDDLLPKRFLEGAKGLPLKAMLAEYYISRGWNEAGIPGCDQNSLPPT
jgi:aldehyde:ferredoxin oxidoreductase